MPTDSETISKLQYHKYGESYDLTVTVDVNLADLCMEMTELFGCFMALDC